MKKKSSTINDERYKMEEVREDLEPRDRNEETQGMFYL